jgi:hypothetical protein
MVIIACSSIGIILCWIIRWDSHFHEHEESGVKHRSMFSEYPPTRQYNRNESCTSVMTCVEPSLQNE